MVVKDEWILVGFLIEWLVWLLDDGLVECFGRWMR